LNFQEILAEQVLPINWEALFHRQTVAHTQQNLTNYKINKKRKRRNWRQFMSTKICEVCGRKLLTNSEL